VSELHGRILHPGARWLLAGAPRMNSAGIEPLRWTASALQNPNGFLYLDRER